MKSGGFKTRGKPLQRGSGFARKAPLRATAPEARTTKPLHRKIRCTAKHGGCGLMFRPDRKDQKACGEACAISMGPHLARLAAEVRAKAERKADAAKREGMKSLAKVRADAQIEFNRYIRLRDRLAGRGCICCGKPLDWNSTKPGGAVDAGHFVSRGSAPELAFDERNVNAQDKGHNRPGGATRAEFTAGMVVRWGRAVVDELEGPNPPTRYRHDDYRRLKAKYRAKANALEKLLP
ncbi:MAG: ninG protein [Rubrivivax sp.]|nr:MAG: ninG protein [Rubrivivax sp.]